jgi:hypothetical protein
MDGFLTTPSGEKIVLRGSLDTRNWEHGRITLNSKIEPYLRGEEVSKDITVEAAVDKFLKTKRTDLPARKDVGAESLAEKEVQGKGRQPLSPPSAGQTRSAALRIAACFETEICDFRRGSTTVPHPQSLGITMPRPTLRRAFGLRPTCETLKGPISLAPQGVAKLTLCETLRRAFRNASNVES